MLRRGEEKENAKEVTRFDGAFGCVAGEGSGELASLLKGTQEVKSIQFGLMQARARTNAFTTSQCSSNLAINSGVSLVFVSKVLNKMLGNPLEL